MLKGNPIRKLKDDFDLPAIELYLNKRIIITDCQSVIDYTKDSIVLCLGEKNLRVTGRNLTANSFCFGQTDINGEIISLEFV